LSETLSPEARRLLRQVVDLGEDDSDGWVVDRTLWEAVQLDPDTYYDAAEELFENQLVEREGTDFAKLRAR
jgi:hypothetical protein